MAKRDATVEERVDLFGFGDQSIEELIQEVGNTALLLLADEELKKSVNREINERIKAYRERLGALRASVTARRCPPSLEVVDDAGFDEEEDE